MAEAARRRGEMTVSRAGDGVIVRLAGAWTLDTGIPPVAEVERALATGPPPVRLAFDLADLGPWDSGLMSFVIRVGELAAARRIRLDEGTLPEGLRRMLALAARVPGQKDVRHVERPSS